ncbi:hypothetical protein N7486_009876 [Penicillium sp. IBT 16267x]|nr:hypothetical protein N7486_009876 [Penicillium sp. IBT 16267x]
MAARSQIPIEILSIINTFAADWVGLENLWQVFPQMRELFTGEPNSKADPEAIRLVESILKENPIMSHELHRHFCMTMTLRQPSLADTSLAVFMNWDYSLSSLDSVSITRGVLQEMVITAANIQRLACACLTALLTRLRKVQPRRYEVVPGRDTNSYRVTGTVPYEPRDAGPPSWIEEYRVYRGLWHLHFYSEILVAAERLKWPQSDLEPLQSDYMDGNQLSPRAAEEIRCVSECLEDLFRANTGHTVKHSAKSNSSNNALITKIPNASQLPCKFNVWSPPLPPSIQNDIWGQGTQMTKHNRMAAFWYICQAFSNMRPAHLQRCSLQDWRPWRALGMPFWDLWRFYGIVLWEAQWPSKPLGPILTPDGVEIPKGGNPRIYGEEMGYRFSVFIEACVKMNFKVERS